MGDVDVPYSEKTLARRIKKLVENGLLFVVASEATNGRPKKVYCSKKFKNPEHELQITKVVKNWGVDFMRGEDVDREIRPDFQLRRLYGELDRGTENLNQVEGRLQHYVHSDAFPVFVCQSKTRMRNILNLGYEFVLGTTLVEALTPDPKCWDSSFGQWSVRKIVQKQVDNLSRDKEITNKTKAQE